VLSDQLLVGSQLLLAEIDSASAVRKLASDESWRLRRIKAILHAAAGDPRTTNDYLTAGVPTIDEMTAAG
jgi:hypothetical protein